MISFAEKGTKDILVKGFALAPKSSVEGNNISVGKHQKYLVEYKQMPKINNHSLL